MTSLPWRVSAQGLSTARLLAAVERQGRGGEGQLSDGQSGTTSGRYGSTACQHELDLDAVDLPVEASRRPSDRLSSGESGAQREHFALAAAAHRQIDPSNRSTILKTANPSHVGSVKRRAHTSRRGDATAILLAILLCLSAAPAQADLVEEMLDVDAPGRWRLAIGPYTQHLNPKPEHQYVWALAIERQRDDQWLYGASYFSNSYGQLSGYLYLGKQYADLFDVTKLYFQWTAGLLYGYKSPYQDQVPFNHNGFSPGLVLSLGWQFDPSYAMQINRVGTAGLMLQFSYAWP